MYDILVYILACAGTLLAVVCIVAIIVLIIGLLKVFVYWVSAKNPYYNNESFIDKITRLINSLKRRKEKE